MLKSRWNKRKNEYDKTRKSDGENDNILNQFNKETRKNMKNNYESNKTNTINNKKTEQIHNEKKCSTQIKTKEWRNVALTIEAK